MSPLTLSPTCPTRDQRPHLQVGLEDSWVPWTLFGSRALYGTHHSATPERSYHLLVKSARKVGGPDGPSSSTAASGVAFETTGLTLACAD